MPRQQFGGKLFTGESRGPALQIDLQFCCPITESGHKLSSSVLPCRQPGCTYHPLSISLSLIKKKKKKMSWHSFILCTCEKDGKREKQREADWQREKMDALPGVHPGAQLLCLLPCLLSLFPILHALRGHWAVCHNIHNVFLQGKMLL